MTLRGAAESNPVLASSMLINAYVEHRKVGWDFEDESPGRDARGFAREGSAPPEVETHLVNTVLTNGARYYVDHAHPEYSTPECSDALELVRADKAGERILARSMQASRRLLEPGQDILVHKNNSDGKGNSYGTHENYLVDRALPFAVAGTHDAAVVRHPPVVHRPRQDRQRERRGGGRLPDQLAGRLLRGGGRPRDHAEASDREHARRTTRRPAEVPPAARDRRRRQPLRGRDLPQGRHDRDRARDDRRRLHRQGPRDRRAGRTRCAPCRTTPRVGRPSRWPRAGRATAIEIQWEFLRLANKYADETGLELCGGEEVGTDVLRRWESTLTALERDPSSLDGTARLGHQVGVARRLP